MWWPGKPYKNTPSFICQTLSYISFLNVLMRESIHVPEIALLAWLFDGKCCEVLCKVLRVWRAQQMLTHLQAYSVLSSFSSSNALFDGIKI